MFEALLAVLQVTIIYHVNYVEGRDSIAFVFVPLSSEAAMRLVCSLSISI